MRMRSPFSSQLLLNGQIWLTEPLAHLAGEVNRLGTACQTVCKPAVDRLHASKALMGDNAEPGLSAAEIRDLRDIAGTMIPESPEHGVRREPDLHDPGSGALYRGSDEATAGDAVRLTQCR
jgi:hypothetical protein